MVCNIWWKENRHLRDYKDHLRNAKLVLRYGITLGDYENLLKEQEGKCKICKQEKKLHVDHCHETGKVRGLLCYQCNNGLGCFSDNKERVLNAAAYLN